MQNQNEKISRHCGHGPRVQVFYKGKTALLNRLDPGYPAGRPSGMTTRNAFTLIELLVVVLIIGILAAVAVPQYQKAVFKTRVAGQLALVDGFLKAQRDYFLANNFYTKDLAALAIETRVGDVDWTCGGESSVRIYCDIHPYPNGILYWNVHLFSSGTQQIECCAKTSSDMATSVCRSYATESGTGGGTGPWKCRPVRTN